jgi:hypothetical protein
VRWPFEAKKRYGLFILNNMATCNHIHLLAFDREEREVIPRTMQILQEELVRNTARGRDAKEPSGRIATMQRLWR